MEYSLDGIDYSNKIPKAKNKGTYTVYYRVEGSDNWDGAEAKSLTVEIGDGVEGANLVLDGTLKINIFFTAEITEEDGWTINGKPVSTTDKIYTYEAPAKDFNSDIVIKKNNKECNYYKQYYS